MSTTVPPTGPKPKILPRRFKCYQAHAKNNKTAHVAWAGFWGIYATKMVPQLGTRVQIMPIKLCVQLHAHTHTRTPVNARPLCMCVFVRSNALCLAQISLVGGGCHSGVARMQQQAHSYQDSFIGALRPAQPCVLCACVRVCVLYAHV